MKCTSGEFTIILSMLKILFPNLCLFLIINMCSKIHEGYRYVDWLFRLVLDQSMCERKFGSISVIFILLCINPLFTSYECTYFVYLNLVVPNLVTCCPRECSWSLGPVGTVE
jgi:hypothetical protein